MAEYVLFVAAVLLVCIYFFGNLSKSPVGQSLNTSLYGMVNLLNSVDGVVKTQ